MIANEHFVPVLGLDLEAYVARGDVNGAQHLIRYAWAMAVLAERRAVASLLDLGCGDGYGSFAIAGRHPHVRVVGVDPDEAAIDAARRRYELPNLEFRVGDAMRWDDTLGADSYDCIVSFDSIEHVEHRELYLEGAVEHLADDGCLMLSTPCGWPVNLVAPEWPAHAIEYCARSLYDFLARYFGTILRPDDGSLPQLEVFRLLEGTGILYLLELNPVLCERPIRIANPYRGRAPRVHARAAALSVFAGDWDGNGTDLPGCYDARSGTAFLLRRVDGTLRWEALVLGFEGIDWRALAGDWRGCGRDTLAFFHARTGRFVSLERNTASAARSEIVTGLGGAAWLPVSGRWRAGAADTLGLFDPGTRTWHLGVGDASRAAPFVFGPGHDRLMPLAGRWSPAGRDAIALYEADSATFHFRHEAAGGESDFAVNYGAPGNLPVVGDWDGDGVDTLGICNLADGCFYLRNANDAGIAHATHALPEALRASLRAAAER